jgi:hypothetical protein
MTVCLECNGNLYDYFELESGFTEYICLKCGYYCSNSPAYLSNPNGFKNMVRENPSILSKIIARSTETLRQGKQPHNGQSLKTILL